jgi:hypothetical protein
MRYVSIGLVAVTVVLALSAIPSQAQSSFFSRRFCTFGGGDSGGEPDCSFNTWEQCMASANGLGRYCGENPYYVAPPRSAGASDSKPAKKSKQRHQNQN